MSKKAINSILIGALLLIWGLVLYQLFWGVDTQGTDAPEITFLQESFNEQQAQDSIVLSLDYRDPFLGKTLNAEPTKQNVLSSGSNGRKTTRLKSTLPTETKTTDWPRISYNGMIENQSDNRQVAIVNIDQNSHLLALGDTASSVKLTNIHSDFILVEWNGERQTVYLK